MCRGIKYPVESPFMAIKVGNGKEKLTSFNYSDTYEMHDP
jgi:hypothetical protein